MALLRQGQGLGSVHPQANQAAPVGAPRPSALLGGWEADPATTAAAWSHVGTTNATSDLTATYSVTLPVGVAEGDLIVLHVTAYNTGAVDTPPTYVRVRETIVPPISRILTFFKIAGVSEPNPTITGTALSGGRVSRMCSVYRGADNHTDIDAESGQALASVTASTAPTITTIVDGDLHVHSVMRGETADSHTPPTGFTEPANGDTAGTPGFAAGAISYDLTNTATTTGSVAGTWSGTQGFGGAHQAAFLAGRVATVATTVSPGVMTATGAVLAPTIQAVALPSPMTASGAVLTPTVRANVLPSPMAASGAVLAPSLFIPVLPGAMTATGQVLLPSIAHQVSPGVMTATGAVLAPSVRVNASPGVMAALGALLAPSIRANVSPGVMAANGQLLVPAVRVQVNPGAMTATGTFYLPVVVSSGATVVSPGVLAAIGQLLAPTAVVVVTPGVMLAAGEMYAPFVDAGEAYALHGGALDGGFGSPAGVVGGFGSPDGGLGGGFGSPNGIVGGFGSAGGLAASFGGRAGIVRK